VIPAGARQSRAPRHTPSIDSRPGPQAMIASAIAAQVM
jgi:hypothetical protein